MYYLVKIKRYYDGFPNDGLLASSIGNTFRGRKLSSQRVEIFRQREAGVKRRPCAVGRYNPVQAQQIVRAVRVNSADLVVGRKGVLTSWSSFVGPMTSRAFSTSRTLSSDSELASLFSEEGTDCMRLFLRRCAGSRSCPASPKSRTRGSASGS